MLLPPETQINKDKDNLKDGLVADFYENNHLKFFGIYHENTFEKYWTISLDETIQEGRVIFQNAYDGTSFTEIYKAGAWERFDNWSENTVPEKMDYLIWVKKWVENIIQEYQSKRD